MIMCDRCVYFDGGPYEGQCNVTDVFPPWFTPPRTAQRRVSAVDGCIFGRERDQEDNE